MSENNQIQEISNLYDSTGKEKYLFNSGIDDGFIIFDVGE